MKIAFFLLVGLLAISWLASLKRKNTLEERQRANQLTGQPANILNLLRTHNLK